MRNYNSQFAIRNSLIRNSLIRNPQFPINQSLNSQSFVGWVERMRNPWGKVGFTFVQPILRLLRRAKKPRRRKENQPRKHEVDPLPFIPSSILRSSAATEDRYQGRGRVGCFRGCCSFIIDGLVKSPKKADMSLRAKRGNPVRSTVPRVTRDLLLIREDPSIRLRRPQDDLHCKSDCHGALRLAMTV